MVVHLKPGEIFQTRNSRVHYPVYLTREKYDIADDRTVEVVATGGSGRHEGLSKHRYGHGTGLLKEGLQHRVLRSQGLRTERDSWGRLPSKIR